jgi:hypothetical protein
LLLNFKILAVNVSSFIDKINPSMEFLTNPDIIEELVPWNEATQKICKLP